MSKIEEWNKMVNWYKEHQETYGWDTKSMIDVVEAIIAFKLAEKYYPSASMASLGLSIEKEYIYRLKKPMIYVSGDSGSNTYTVSYQHGQGNTKHQKEYKIAQMSDMLKSIDKWLEYA